MISGFKNGKIDFERYSLCYQLVYMTSTTFKKHMYSLVHEFIIIKYFEIKCRPLSAPRTKMFICVFLVIIEWSAT